MYSRDEDDVDYRSGQIGGSRGTRRNEGDVRGLPGESGMGEWQRRGGQQEALQRSGGKEGGYEPAYDRGSGGSYRSEAGRRQRGGDWPERAGGPDYGGRAGGQGGWRGREDDRHGNFDQGFRGQGGAPGGDWNRRADSEFEQGRYGSWQNTGGGFRDWGQVPDQFSQRQDWRGGYQARQQHHDPDYQQWRREQVQRLDDDYEAFRRERYGKFSDEFNTWRTNRERQQAGGSDATGSASGGSRNKQASEGGSRPATSKQQTG